MDDKEYERMVDQYFADLRSILITPVTPQQLAEWGEAENKHDPHKN